MKKPKGHKASCGCPFCKAYKRQKRKTPKVKKAKTKQHKRRSPAKTTTRKKSRKWVFK